MNKRKFVVQDFDFIEEDDESQFATVQIDAFSSGENRHDLICSVELLKSTASTLYEKPIVFEVDGLLKDFGSHVDSEDKRRIAGFIVPNSAEFFDRDDGRVGLRVQGKIWRYYAQWALDVFKSAADMVKKISVEMLMADPKGNTMTDFEYTGVCLLGDLFTEASPDAQARLLSFSTEDYEKAYRETFAKYSEIDFAIPKKMKSNAQLGLDLRSEKGSGGTAVAVSLAKYIIREDNLSPEKVRQIAKYFARSNVSLPSDKESVDWISWNLYGGTASVKLTKKLVKEIDAEDESLMAYFDGGNAPDSKNALGDNSEGKEKNMKKDKKEKEVFEEEVKPEDEEVSMAEDAPETEEEMAAEEDGEDAEEQDMAEEESEEEESEEDMACDDLKKMDLEFALTAQVIKEQLNSALEKYKDNNDWSMYYVETYDDDYAYVYCYEDYKTYRMAIVISENSVAIEVNREEEVVRSYVAVEKAIATEKEFAELREFKANIEKKQFEIKVETVLGSVKHLFDADGLGELRKDAVENYSLETLTGWENIVKAKAFTISENLPEEEVEDDGVLKIALITDNADEPVYDSIWD